MTSTKVRQMNARFRAINWCTRICEVCQQKYEIDSLYWKGQGIEIHNHECKEFGKLESIPLEAWWVRLARWLAS